MELDRDHEIWSVKLIKEPTNPTMKSSIVLFPALLATAHAGYIFTLNRTLIMAQHPSVKELDNFLDTRFEGTFLKSLGMGTGSISDADIQFLKSLDAVTGVYEDQHVFLSENDTQLSIARYLNVSSYETIRPSNSTNYPQWRYKPDKPGSENRSPLNRTIFTQKHAPDHLVRLTSRKKWKDIDNHAYYYDATGKGITVYLLDNGVQLTNEEFEGRVFAGADFGGIAENGPMLNHGTHVAGLICSKTYGVAKEAQLVDVKVADSFGISSMSQVLAGLDSVLWDMAFNQLVGSPVVINLSLATKGKSPWELTPLLQAVEMINTIPGVVVVASLGNLKSSVEFIGPAALNRVIIAGSSDVQKDLIATFSNHLSQPSSEFYVFAPGVDIQSVNSQNPEKPSIMSGSSTSSALTSGVVLLYLEKGAPSNDIGQVLVAKSTKGLLQPLDQLSLWRFSETPKRLLYSGPLIMDLDKDLDKI